jgi:hypothetical protein
MSHPIGGRGADYHHGRLVRRIPLAVSDIAGIHHSDSQTVASSHLMQLAALGTVARDPALRSSGTPSNRQNPSENIRAESGAKELSQIRGYYLRSGPYFI